MGTVVLYVFCMLFFYIFNNQNMKNNCIVCARDFPLNRANICKYNISIKMIMVKYFFCRRVVQTNQRDLSREMLHVDAP